MAPLQARFGFKPNENLVEICWIYKNETSAAHLYGNHIELYSMTVNRQQKLDYYDKL